MQIGISTSVIQRGRTGVARYVLSLTRALLPHAGQHHFTLFVLEEDLPLFAFAASQMEIVTVPEKFRAPVRDILWHQTQLPKLARQHTLDVLHVPSYRRMLWRKPCALVATIHDLAMFHVAKKYDWRRMFYGRVVVRRLARRQDAIIAVSQSTADDIAKHFGLSAEKVTVIHNGLEHDRLSPASREQAKAATARRYGLMQPFFLYVARLEHPGKNHARLIAAFNEFKTATRSNWQLVFAGSDWHGAEVIHAAIKQSPFATDIRSLGFVADTDLPELYRAADVFVYPSLYEGFGFPPLEAMACGCPVISSASGSLGEVVGNAARMMNPEDVKDLKTALAELAGSAALRERLSAAGLARAKNFDWGKTTEQILRIYAKAVLNAHGKRASKSK